MSNLLHKAHELKQCLTTLKIFAFLTLGQFFSTDIPHHEIVTFSNCESRENTDLENNRKLSPLQPSLCHPEKYVLSIIWKMGA